MVFQKVLFSGEQILFNRQLHYHCLGGSNRDFAAWRANIAPHVSQSHSPFSFADRSSNARNLADIFLSGNDLHSGANLRVSFHQKA